MRFTPSMSAVVTTCCHPSRQCAICEDRLGVRGKAGPARTISLLKQAQALGLRAKMRLTEKRFDAAIKDVVRAASYANVLMGPFVDEV